MLTSDDRKEVDLYLQRGSIVRGVFRDILELLIFKICHNKTEDKIYLKSVHICTTVQHKLLRVFNRHVYVSIV